MSDSNWDWSDWVDGLRVGVMGTSLTLEWEEDSPYAELCSAIEKDNNLFLEILEDALELDR